MKRALLFLLSVVCVSLGFNTLDAMIWEFYWNGEWWRSQGLWAWTPLLRLDVWWSYVVGGIVPLALGCVLMGWLIGKRFL